MLYMFLTVVRMNRFRPAPALGLFRGHTGVIEPHLIEEVTEAIGASRPCCCGDRIDDLGKIALGRLQSLFRPLTVIDVSEEEIPRPDRIFCISYRDATNPKPSIYTVGTPAAVLDVVDGALFNRLDASLDDAGKVIRMNGVAQSPV